MEKGILVSIQNLMESMDWTAEQAMYTDNLRK